MKALLTAKASLVAAVSCAAFIVQPAQAAPSTTAPQPVETGNTNCALESSVVIKLDGGGLAEAQKVANSIAAPQDTCSAAPAKVIAGNGKVAAAASNDVGGYKTFTLRGPTFNSSGSQGTFGAQVNYDNPARSVQFVFRLSGALVAVATGPVKAVGARKPVNCTYSKEAVPASYTYHWSCPSHKVDKRYDWKGSYVFRVNVGGNPGTATVTNTFGYVITNVAS